MSTPTQEAKQPALKNVAASCEYLGNISRSSLYRLVAAHKIQPVRVTRGRTMFAVADLDALIAASKDRKPNPRRAA